MIVSYMNIFYSSLFNILIMWDIYKFVLLMHFILTCNKIRQCLRNSLNK